jgi:hypothetical protein
MKVLVISYSDRFATPSLFADKASLLSHHDEEFRRELGAAADEAAKHPGESVDCGDGDSLLLLSVNQSN